MTEETRTPSLNGEEILAALGYRHTDKRRKKKSELAASNSQPVLAARTVSNTRAIADFDNLLSNVRQLKVTHTRVAASKLEKALWRIQGGSR